MQKEINFGLGDLLGIGMTFVVLGIGLTYGLNVMADVKDDIGVDACSDKAEGPWTYNSSDKLCYGSGTGNSSTPDAAEFNASSDAITGVAKIPEKLPTIATVVVAAVIIGILIRYLWVRGTM